MYHPHFMGEEHGLRSLTAGAGIQSPPSFHCTAGSEGAEKAALTHIQVFECARLFYVYNLYSPSEREHLPFNPVHGLFPFQRRKTFCGPFVIKTHRE